MAKKGCGCGRTKPNTTIIKRTSTKPKPIIKPKPINK